MPKLEDPEDQAEVLSGKDKKAPVPPKKPGKGEEKQEIEELTPEEEEKRRKEIEDRERQN